MNIQLNGAIIGFLLLLFAFGASAQTVTDIDGNVYRTVKIGSQVWMAENLKTSKLNNGESIKSVKYNNDWSDANYPLYCWYDNNESLYSNPFGALYNWYTVGTNKLCPIGWHVPSQSEWGILINYLVKTGQNYDGSTIGNKAAKSIAAKKHWRITDDLEYGSVAYNQSENNSSGFNGYPAGYRSNIDGHFAFIGTEAKWWTSTQSGTYHAYYFSITYFENYIDTNNASKTIGGSVRCIKD